MYIAPFNSFYIYIYIPTVSEFTVNRDSVGSWTGTRTHPEVSLLFLGLLLYQLS